MRLPALLILLITTPASAAPIIDQQALPSGGVYWNDNDTQNRQTVTIETTGLLTRVDFFIKSNVGALGRCETLSCGVSVSYLEAPTVFTRQKVLIDPVPGWLVVEFSSPLPVTAGQVIVISYRHDGIVGIARARYDGGSLIHRCNSDGCVDPTAENPIGSEAQGEATFELEDDYAFRVWIEPQAVSEPKRGELALLAVLLALGARHAERAWRAGRGSNPRPPGSKPGALSS